MKTTQDASARRDRRIEVLLLGLALALSAVCFLSSFSAELASVQKKTEALPVSLSSKQAADYSAPTPSAHMPAARLDLIAEVIHDSEPDANVQARYDAVLANLKTPIAGGPPTPSPTATRELPRGVYVTNIRLDPPEPKQQQDFMFNVTFLNTTGQDQTFRWFVFIYRQGQSSPFGQTSSDKVRTIPAGTIEQAAVNTWKMGSSEPCTTLEAKVHWQDPDGSRPAFNSPDGHPYVLTFTMCQ